MLLLNSTASLRRRHNQRQTPHSSPARKEPSKLLMRDEARHRGAAYPGAPKIPPESIFNGQNLGKGLGRGRPSAMRGPVAIFLVAVLVVPVRPVRVLQQ